MPITGNQLLDVFSPPLQQTVLNAAMRVDLESRASLFHVREAPTHGYFLLTGVASMVVSMTEGGSAEVGMIGGEGLIGGSALLGPAPMEADAFMQIPGAGLRVPMRVLRTLFSDDEEFRTRVLQFQQSQINIATQLSACNKLHEAEARLARWLLMTSDRARTSLLTLTQEFLAQMLGTQRTTVALVAGVLQRAGFIDYRRGALRIIDRDALTSVACDCYGVTRKILERLYSNAPRSQPDGSGPRPHAESRPQRSTLFTTGQSTKPPET